MKAHLSACELSAFGVHRQVVYFWCICILFMSACGPMRLNHDDVLKGPAVSPSGEYEVLLIEDAGHRFSRIGFRIVATESSDILFEETPHYLATHTLFITWGEDDSLWVYSGDSGTIILEMNKTDAWKKSAFVDSKKTPPAVLQTLRPRRFGFDGSSQSSR